MLASTVISFEQVLVLNGITWELVMLVVVVGTLAVDSLLLCWRLEEESLSSLVELVLALVAQDLDLGHHLLL